MSASSQASPATTAAAATSAVVAAAVPAALADERRSWALWFVRWSLVNLLAAISFALLVGSDATVAGYLVVAAALVVTIVPFRFDLLERFALAPALLTAGALASLLFDRTQAETWLRVLTGTLVVGTVAAKPIVRNLAVAPPPTVANLPGLEARRRPRVGVEGILIADALLVIAVGVVDLANWRLVVLVAIVGLLDVITILMLILGLRVRIARQYENSAVPSALEAYGPKFAVYFSGPPESEYQLLMWLEHLDRVGERYVIILREPLGFEEFSRATSAPVVVRPRIGELDTAVVPSLRAMIYVNNSAKNTHAVRFAELQHIQLLHGDSDKPPSFSPVTAMYDRIFVAGQAGIDRYARKGVLIPAEKFDIVGRPQVAAVEAATTPITELADKTVLYAPTWTGHYGDTDYCSLHLAEPIVRGLLDRGATVILRHHPYSLAHPPSAASIARVGEILAEDQRRTGRAHRWGSDIQDGTTLFECFNLADALVADVSSVVSDFLYSTKPFALVAVAESGEAFVEEFPLASAAYVIEGDLHNLDAALDDLLVRDPIAGERALTRTYYLGDIDEDHYTETFPEAVRRYL